MLLIVIGVPRRMKRVRRTIPPTFGAEIASCMVLRCIREILRPDYWSTFGQAVILALIQIGGLGVVTVAASFALLSGRRISLMQRSSGDRQHQQQRSEQNDPGKT